MANITLMWPAVKMSLTPLTWTIGFYSRKQTIGESKMQLYQCSPNRIKAANVRVYATLTRGYAKAAVQGYVFWKYGLQSSSNLIMEQ